MSGEPKTTNWKLDGLDLEVGTVYGIGRNYAEHAKELGNAVPSAPVVFLKPRSALCLRGEPIRIPTQSARVDHEVELVVAIGKAGRNISRERALDYVAGYAVGVDVTARDLQEVAKKSGLSWAVAKGFESFAPLGKFTKRAASGDGPFDLELKVNGEKRQSGSTKDMLFDLPEMIRYLSSIFRLEPGDLIFTGTPPGVAPIKAGDALEARLGDFARLDVRVE